MKMEPDECGLNTPVCDCMDMEFCPDCINAERTRVLEQFEPDPDWLNDFYADMEPDDLYD